MRRINKERKDHKETLVSLKKGGTTPVLMD